MNRIIQAGILAMLVSGCANWSSVYRDFSVDDGEGAMVDIKQRAVIASKKTITTKLKDAVSSNNCNPFTRRANHLAAP